MGVNNSHLTEEWQQYQKGIDYNIQLNYYDTYDKNEAFYAGDQWRGVKANGLPTPVFNIFKRVINYFISTILSQRVTLNFASSDVPDEPTNDVEMLKKETADIITEYSNKLWEKLKMDSKCQEILLNAAISGDACSYIMWNASVDRGEGVRGDIDIELPDGGNVFFGNPNLKDVQKQPYIIISYRELVSKLKEEAKREKIPESEIEYIGSDDDTSYQAGDLGKIELSSNDSKTTVLMKFYRNPKTGTIFWKKSTKHLTIIEDRDTKLRLYPITWMNWDDRKNSYHGQAVGTGLIPNQIFINKLFAMAMLNLQNTAFPKIVYDKTRISGISNQVGAAIGVQGDILHAIDAVRAGDMSGQVMQVIDLAIRYTKDMIGASDTALGNIKPENTSAIIAVSQQANVPLETIKRKLWQFIEDIGNIFVDYMANYYGVRKIKFNGQIVDFDFSILKNIKMDLKVEVGSSSYWSEIANIQTLDNLLQAGHISIVQYLERMPNGMIIKKQELLDELKQVNQAQQQTYEQMSQFIETLPPDVQAQLKSLPPDKMEIEVRNLMNQTPPQ